MVIPGSKIKETCDTTREWLDPKKAGKGRESCLPEIRSTERAWSRTHGLATRSLSEGMGPLNVRSYHHSMLTKIGPTEPASMDLTTSKNTNGSNGSADAVTVTF